MVGCVSSANGLDETQFHQLPASPDDEEPFLSESRLLGNSDYSIDELFVSSDDSNLEMSVVTISMY